MMLTGCSGAGDEAEPVDSGHEEGQVQEEAAGEPTPEAADGRSDDNVLDEPADHVEDEGGDEGIDPMDDDWHLDLLRRAWDVETTVGPALNDGIGDDELADAFESLCGYLDGAGATAESARGAGVIVMVMGPEAAEGENLLVEPWRRLYPAFENAGLTGADGDNDDLITALFVVTTVAEQQCPNG